MNYAFINSIESEWIKKRRSLASWLVIIGAAFTPLIVVIARIVYSDGLVKLYSSQSFWFDHWKTCWESVAIFLLPMGIILAASLITQLEYRNNTWKQLHTTPLRYTTIYFSKLTVILVMIIQFLVLFNICILSSALLLPLIFSHVPFPPVQPDFSFFLRETLLFFVDCLPVIALQYVVALHFKNFLIPIGAGILIWITSLGALSWKYSYFIPYTYTIINFMKVADNKRVSLPGFDFHWMASGYFVLIIVVGYLVYVSKGEKG